MKNEFLLKRIMLTPNKKNYASIVMMQEGKVFNNPKLDIKGLPIRKVSVNKKIRDYFTELLDNDILKADKINLSTIIYKYKALEDEIRESLKSGSTEFSTPNKANDPSSYVNPYQIMSLKAALIWNILFPNEEISLPQKINIIKVKIPSYDYLVEKLKENDLYDEYIDDFNRVFANQNLIGKDGINAIALPKTLTKIPKVLRIFVDYDTIIADSIKPGIIMLESLGFKTLDILTNQFPTNIIEV